VKKNKTLTSFDEHKFRFHKLLKIVIERWCYTVKTRECFAKSNNLNYPVIESCLKSLSENILSKQKIQ